MMKKPIIIMIVCLVVLGSSLFVNHTIQTVHASTSNISAIRVLPLSTCCGTSNVPYNIGDSFIINVVLNLTSGEKINGFDVSLNYSNPESGSAPGILHAISIDYSQNIFSQYQGEVLLECKDGILVQGSGGCNGEGIGQIHLGEVTLGQALAGPLNGILFSVAFQVTGYGNSTFLIDRSNLSNPNPDPSNPQLINPHYITVLKYDGVFGNIGVVAFFNYEPVDTTVTSAVLPNQPVYFDASASFVPGNVSIIKYYHWSFGDNTPAINSTSIIVQHLFKLAGNYTVTLTVSDSRQLTGTISRRVPVSTGLGSLLLTVEDKSGTLHRSDVTVNIYNSSVSPRPILTKTVDGFGNVQFNNLTAPSNYYLTFSGASVQDDSKIEPVKPGLTSIDTIFLTSKPSQTDYSGIIYAGTILGGIGIILAAIIYQKRKSAQKKRRPSISIDSRRASSRKTRISK